MGLIDSVNSLKNEIKQNQETQRKGLKEAERKQIIKYILLDKLKLYINEAQEKNEDLKNLDLMYNTIEAITKERKEAGGLLINEGMTRYFLLENYPKITSKILKEAEAERKKTEKTTEAEAKELEKEKIKLQKQLQKELEAERIRKAEARQTIIEAVKLICMIILSPLLIIAFMIIAICKDKNFK